MCDHGTLGRVRLCLTTPTNSHLEEMGFGRDTFVEGIKAIVEAELDAADAETSQAAPVNPNLMGAV